MSITTTPDVTDRIDPASIAHLRQLLRLHGARRVLTALADISRLEGDVAEKANPRDATAPFALRANATMIEHFVRRLYS